MKNNGLVKYDDIYICEPTIKVDVEIYDKKLFEELKEQDLVWASKSVPNVDWKSFQDEIGYLKEDMVVSDFSMRLHLENGILHIYVIWDNNGDIVMEYIVSTEIVMD